MVNKTVIAAAVVTLLAIAFYLIALATPNWIYSAKTGASIGLFQICGVNSATGGCVPSQGEWIRYHVLSAKDVSVAINVCIGTLVGAVFLSFLSTVILVVSTRKNLLSGNLLALTASAFSVLFVVAGIIIFATMLVEDSGKIKKLYLTKAIAFGYSFILACIGGALNLVSTLLCAFAA
uniref:uncharacterized protein LOC120329245 n=1 Tax=Styela clava TaxID=7725 RepID=UPI001939EA7F|nr:uncharacterized protein LOC120329245 [Styela clava]